MCLKVSGHTEFLIFHLFKKMVIQSVRRFIEDILGPTDVYASMRPLMFLNFISGLSAFHLVGSAENRHLKVTYFGFLNTVVHVVVFCACHIMRVTSMRTFIGYFFNTTISRFTNDIQNLTQSIAIAVSLISCFLKRNKFRSLMHAMAIIDKKLIRLGATIDYKAIMRMTMILVITKLISYSTLVAAGYFLLRSAGIPDISVWILFFLPHIIVSNLKITFMFILSQISNRFRYISHILNRIRQKNDQINILPMRGSMDDIKIRKFTGMTSFEWNFANRENYKIISDLCKVHEELCDACYLAEEFFCHQMLTLTAIDFSTLLCCSYYIVDAIYNENQIINVHRIGFILFFAYYMLLSLATVYGVLRSAGKVTQEVNWFCCKMS